MQNNLFLRRLIIVTDKGDYAYNQEFHRGVNIIRGQNSSGKSTIIRFIFFALGGCYSDFVPEALKCQYVLAEVETNGKVLLLKRFLERQKDGRVNPKASMYIYFGSISEYKEDKRTYAAKWQKFGFAMNPETRSFSNVLFEVMGLPEIKADNNITMYQILRLIYLDQESPLSSLFFFDPWDREIIRDTIASLLMGLYDENHSQAKLDLIAINKKIEELTQNIKFARKNLPSTTNITTAYIKELIESKKKEIVITQDKIKQLRDALNLEHGTSEFKLEYERLRQKIQALRDKATALDESIALLKADIEDSTYFIKSLEKKMQAVERSMATREYFDNLHLEYCPECLTKIDDNVEEGHCRLCKSPVDNSKGKSQAQRIKLELSFQLRESQMVKERNQERLKKKEAERITLQRELQLAQEQYDYSVRDVRSCRDEEIDKLISDKGFMEGEILQFMTMLERAEEYENLIREKNRLENKAQELTSYIADKDKKYRNQKNIIERAIKENGLYLLRNDKDRQAEFSTANDFSVDFGQNITYLTDRHIKLSASSAFYLKMTARFAFFLSSLQVDGMMYPRLILSDNMEDKGMEDSRSQNFQNILVRRLNELEAQKNKTLNLEPGSLEPSYQVIFATSMIAPELDKQEYIIGDYYTRDNKSLKNV